MTKKYISLLTQLFKPRQSITQQPFKTVNKAVEHIQSITQESAEFKLLISDELNDAMGANMAIILDVILDKGFEPFGFEQKEGYMVYVYQSLQCKEKAALSEYWGITANIKPELPYGEGGQEVRIGTKQFRGGAKVYIVGCYPGMCESLVVIGQNRHSNRFIRSVVRVNVVENMRIKMIYGKSAIALCQKPAPIGARMLKNKEDAEKLLSLIPQWCNGV